MKYIVAAVLALALYLVGYSVVDATITTASAKVSVGYGTPVDIVWDVVKVWAALLFVGYHAIRGAVERYFSD